MSSYDMAALRFLVVDDEEFVRTLSVRILKTMGATDITTANDGRHAIEQLIGAAEPFDIVICDLNMPQMDGVQLLRHVAERDFTGGIVLLSGEDERLLASAHQLAQAHHLNILGSIAKPLKPAALQALVDRFKPQSGGKVDLGQVAITEDELRDGIENDELQVMYQPKVHVTSGKVLGAEVLARWPRPGRGVLGPASFVPLAEQLGLAGALTRSIFGKAMRQAGEWAARGYQLDVAVNVAVETLSQLEFADYFIDTALRESVDLSRVTLEVTETQIFSDLVRPLETVMRLRMKRIGLAIDDFGTGYASLEQLKRVPFTELKIDRAFVSGAAHDASARAILEASVELGRKLQMHVVAEGVETREDWDQIARLNCDAAQGFFVARPMPAAEFETWLGSWAGVG